jgi:hypothetical protein
MRAQDILVKEASIIRKLGVKYHYGMKFILRGAGGDALTSIIKTSGVPDFNKTEELTLIQNNPPGDVDEVQYGRGNNVITFERPNGKFLQIIGTQSNIENSLSAASSEKTARGGNIGDLSEPVLSAAVIAKLIKRGGSKVEDITGDDVKTVLNGALASDGLVYNVFDQNSRIADNIEFSMRLRDDTKMFINSPMFWPKYDPILPSVVHYANSGQIDKYADYFYKNGKVDKVRVISDGVSDAKARKTDVEALVFNEKTGKVDRPLQNLNLSLKAGSNKLGIVGGGSLNQYKLSGKDKGTENATYIQTNAQKLFGELGVGVPEYNGRQTKAQYWDKVYKTAATELRNMLKDRSVRTESQIVEKIARMIQNHAQKSETSVRLVNIDRKRNVSTVHTFKNLETRLVNMDIDLTAQYIPGQTRKGEKRPALTIYDANSGYEIIRINVIISDTGNLNNEIHMGKLLSKLTEVQFTKNKPKEPEQGKLI